MAWCPFCGQPLADRGSIVIEHWHGTTSLWSFCCGKCGRVGEVADAHRSEFRVVDEER
jgi:hypothetical protein